MLSSAVKKCTEKSFENCFEIFFLKGSVSRDLRWVLLYINQKLFSRPIIASHKILTFLKGQFTIDKKQAGAPLLRYGFIRIILKSQENGCFRNIEIRNSPSEWYDIMEKYLSTILPGFLLVLWVHIGQMKVFPHSNMAERYYFRDIISLRGACCKFQYCES